MHPDFLDILCCPLTSAPLELTVARAARDGQVVSGELVSSRGKRYPIVNGVPRFVDSASYATSFGVEWSRWSRTQFDSENVGRPMAGYTARMWDSVTGKGDAGLDGQTIVEYGCGPGRFLETVRAKGGRAVGLELSAAADVAGRNFADDPNVLVVQGDILNPPFREGVFDGAYSIGVLHHTPDPAGGLMSLARRVRPGGWVACCVYPSGEFYDYRSVARARSLHHRLQPHVGYRFASAYATVSAYGLSPVFARLRRIPGLAGALDGIAENWLPILPLPDPRWSKLDLFDAITPEIATTHGQDELLGWFAEAECADVEITPWCDTSAVGIVG
jgi:SAM-dependent methyltransferase